MDGHVAKVAVRRSGDYPGNCGEPQACAFNPLAETTVMSQSQRSQVSDNPSTNEIMIDKGEGFKVYMIEDRKGKHPVYRLQTENADGELYTASSPGCCAFLSKARLLDAAQPPYLRPNYQKLLTQMIGAAIALAIRVDLSKNHSQDRSLEEAKIALDRAETFMKDRATETARIHYVGWIGLLLFLLYSPFVLFSVYADLLNPQALVVKLYLLAFVGGALGAGFSLLTRVGKIEIDPEVDRRSHRDEVFYRLAVGALAALIIVIGLEANVFAGFTNVSSSDGRITEGLYNRTFWFLLVSSIAAGFSERLVPSLLEQFAKKRTVTSDAKRPDAKRPEAKKPAGDE
jgi:hypothetical protein